MKVVVPNAREKRAKVVKGNKEEMRPRDLQQNFSHSGS
jgi:hypothetical protein